MTREEKRELAKTFVWHGSWTESMANMDAGTRDKITVALQNYGCLGIAIPSEIMQLNFPFINEVKNQIDKDKANWVSTCKRNDANNKKQNQKSKEGRVLISKIQDLMKNGVPLDGDILSTLIKESKIDVKSDEMPPTNAETAINLNNLNNECDSDSKSNCDIDVVSEGSCDTDCVSEHEHEPERNINYLKNNLSSSTTSSLNNKGEGGEEVVGEVLSFSNEELEKIQQCIMKGVGEDYAKERYAYYRSLGFKFGSKEIGDVIALIISNWKKDKKALEKEMRQKAKDERKKQEAALFEKSKMIPQEALDKWKELMDELPENSRTYASGAFRILSMDERCLVIHSPSVATYEAFNANFKGRIMWERLRQLFPAHELKIVYGI